MRFRNIVCAIVASTSLTAVAQSKQLRTESSSLAPGFIAAIESYSGMATSFKASKATAFWLHAMEEKGIDPQILGDRLRRHNMRAIARGLKLGNAYNSFLSLQVEEFSETSSRKFFAADPVALHLTKLSVLDEYDDFWNDDIYVYTITTYGDKVWGKVSSIYENMDEGSEVFFNAADRGVFGPKGDALGIANHLIVDVGVIESDGDDVKQLQQLSSVIVDLAVIALTIEHPQAGVAAAKARQEVKNLLNLIIALDSDDRLVTDSMYFQPDQVSSLLQGQSFREFNRHYEKEDSWSHFSYRLLWRFLKP